MLQEDDQCSVLLMDEAGSVGLDLSFVSWVFLMEPLENASLEEQVISRAHRMGAKATVHVETLVMRVSVISAVQSLSRDTSLVHNTAIYLLSALLPET